MRTNLKILFALMLGMAVVSCQDMNRPAEQETAGQQMVAEVLTSAEQAALTPDEVLNNLKEGNERYVANDITPRDLPKQVKATTGGQFPQAVVLSCIDSRVPVEYVLDQGVGDIFVARVAGNFVNEDILGSMEYGCKVAGSKLIVVLGHESCGAVKAAIDDVELGNITPMLANIKPAVQKSQDFEGEKTSKNHDFVTHVCKNNVHLTIEDIRERSPILKEMEENGEIKIVGAIYEMDSGKVVFL